MRPSCRLIAAQQQRLLSQHFGSSSASRLCWCLRREGIDKEAALRSESINGYWLYGAVLLISVLLFCSNDASSRSGVTVWLWVENQLQGGGSAAAWWEGRALFYVTFRVTPCFCSGQYWEKLTDCIKPMLCSQDVQSWLGLGFCYSLKHCNDSRQQHDNKGPLIHKQEEQKCPVVFRSRPLDSRQTAVKKHCVDEWGDGWRCFDELFANLASCAKPNWIATAPQLHYVTIHTQTCIS